jgi:hypothetical protein
MIPLAQHETRLKEFVRAVNQLITGLSNAKGTVTLNAGATTTTVTNENVTTLSYPVLTAGSGTWASTVMRITTISAGSFVITHSNEAATDRVVYWHI